MVAWLEFSHWSRKSTAWVIPYLVRWKSIMSKNVLALITAQNKPDQVLIAIVGVCTVHMHTLVTTRSSFRIYRKEEPGPNDTFKPLALF